MDMDWMTEWLMDKQRQRWDLGPDQQGESIEQIFKLVDEKVTLDLSLDRWKWNHFFIKL